jgi:PAS domain S-box-containing protein
LSPDWIVGVDTTGAILFANKSFRQFHSFDSESARGTPITELLEGAAEQIETAIERALAGDSVTFEHVTADSTNEQERPVQNTVSPLRGEGGEISGAVLAVQDLSDIKQHERQLEVLDRVLRHNLSNKITVIGGYTEAIQHQTDDKDTIALTEQILTAASELNDLVDKERQITRVLTDTTPGKVVDLRQIVETSVSSVERTFPEANIRLDIPDDPVQIVGGPLGRAVEELLQNAITHSDLAAPSVSVRVWSGDDKASLTVSDDGPGIPEADQDVVAGTEKIQPLLHGQGLGLWLVKFIVDQAGGTLRFDNNDPRGTIVTVQFPLATDTVPLEPTEKQTPSRR